MATEARNARSSVRVAFDTATLPGIALLGSARTTASIPGDQYIEASIGNIFQGHDPSVEEWFQYVEAEHWLFTQVQPDGSCLALWISIRVGSSPVEQRAGEAEVDFVVVNSEGNTTWFGSGSVAPLPGWQANPNYLVRFETTASGHCRAYIDGVLVAEDDLPPVGGPHVGMGISWYRTNYGGALNDGTNPGVSTRMEYVCFGSTAPGVTFWSDTFDRADGPLGANWLLGQGAGWTTNVDAFAIASNAAVATVVGTGHTTMMLWHHSQPGDVMIEALLDDVWVGDGTYFQLYVRANPSDKEALMADWFFQADGSISTSLYYFDASGAQTSPSAATTVAHTASGTVTVRLAASGGGMMRASVDGVEIAAGVAPALPPGHYVGMGTELSTVAPDQPSPTVVQISGSSGVI